MKTHIVSLQLWKVAEIQEIYLRKGVLFSEMIEWDLLTVIGIVPDASVWGLSASANLQD